MFLHPKYLCISLLIIPLSLPKSRQPSPILHPTDFQVVYLQADYPPTQHIQPTRTTLHHTSHQHWDWTIAGAQYIFTEWINLSVDQSTNQFWVQGLALIFQKSPENGVIVLGGKILPSNLCFCAALLLQITNTGKVHQTVEYWLCRIHI